MQNQKVTQTVLCDISNGRSRGVEFDPGVVRGHQVQNEKVTLRISCDVSNGRSGRVEFSPGVFQGH